MLLGSCGFRCRLGTCARDRGGRRTRSRDDLVHRRWATAVGRGICRRSRTCSWRWSARGRASRRRPASRSPTSTRCSSVAAAPRAQRARDRRRAAAAGRARPRPVDVGQPRDPAQGLRPLGARGRRVQERHGPERRAAAARLPRRRRPHRARPHLLHLPRRAADARPTSRTTSTPGSSRRSAAGLATLVPSLAQTFRRLEQVARSRSRRSSSPARAAPARR